jgi:preprotein translocase subunit SecF
VNDTVVVYDRVRENEEKRMGEKLKAVINISLNETLTRTMLTSATTLIVALIMFAMGGGVIHDFFFAITIGVAVGTYSSVFVAAPIVLLFDKLSKKSV